ncbi:MAG TPA: radical SAM protein [Polyangiaceae bacterium]
MPEAPTPSANLLASPPPVRMIRKDELDVAKPIYVVWELTMKCDQPCQHCGSRAGRARDDELRTEEILEVAKGLVRLGTREVTLIGGEAYLRPDLVEIVKALAGSGIRVTMQTGGRAFTLERARTLRDAGLDALGVSVDGPGPIHDRIRGNLGSHHAAIQALKNAGAVGMVLAANTQVNRLTADHLVETARQLRSLGVEAWQPQLTGPMGRAAEHPEWILEPWRIVEVIDTLAAIQEEAIREHKTGVPFNVACNNNIGYFGPHEQILRSRPGDVETHWRGCAAGTYVMGIESDGTVKGCPTLPTEEYAGGNVRDLDVGTLWNTSPAVRFARDRKGTDDLWGFCKTCYYADVCQAGCAWTTHVTLGRRGNNPFCYHRVTELRKKGIRERLEPVERAPQRPYDHGRFVIVEEPWPEG